jgi:Cysteine-rich secretory protein family
MSIMHRVVEVLACVVLLVAASAAQAPDLPTDGVPLEVQPSWRERAIAVLTNAVRLSPAAYRASPVYGGVLSPSLNAPNVLGPVYPPQAPLVLDPAISRHARRHAHDMALRNVFAHSTTDTLAENIGAGADGDPLATMHRWLCDRPSPSSRRCCADGDTCDGHRRNIMGGAFQAIGVGHAYNPVSKYQHYWTQNFGGARATTVPALVDGAHVFAGTTIRFLANVHGMAPPRSVVLLVDGARVPMSLDLGTQASGTYAVGRARGAACRSYAFELVDASGAAYRHPVRGYFRTAGEGRCLDAWVQELP